MRVIKAQAGRLGRKHDTNLPSGRNEGRALLGRTVHGGGYSLTMPVQLLRRIRLVGDFDTDRLPLFETKQRAGKLPIVSGHRNNSIRREFDWYRFDLESVIHVRAILNGEVNCLGALSLHGVLAGATSRRQERCTRR